uniref:FBD domain-containing protein n=1 Tax=Oryza punctata TaxID=4537 RepID=A0A0E0LH25_ORYPU
MSDSMVHASAVSWPRFPSLEKLIIQKAQGLTNFVIHSESLLNVVLKSLKGLLQLDVVAPALAALCVLRCFADASARSHPVARISAPNLEILRWSDAFDLSSVQFDKMENLQLLGPLGTSYFYVYGEEGYNQDCLRLLQHFQFDAIPGLRLKLVYLPDIINREYLMEDMTVLPDIVFLILTVMANGHCIGPSLFHVLRKCTGVRRLKLALRSSDYLEAEAECKSCICDLPPNWTSEQLVLNSLHEVKITHLRGTKHENGFCEAAIQLGTWAAMLKEVTINFCGSITESTAKELCQMLLSFTSREIILKFRVGHGSHMVFFPKTNVHH